ncbi:MAG TPA: MFS transporter [Steroidobacteraceae bacterium]|nr:MFS transporter [Steroidobacteraceae bacterium]
MSRAGPAGSARKPELSFWQIWNMCFGFLGIQFGFALQTADVSRIFQTLGADINELPMLWLAAPLTGLIVQPIIGYLSDHTWTRLGRRRPYFLGGALLASLALLLMPNSTAVWAAAGVLWIMDASINVSMEPFRAFVGDQLPERQRPLGFALQSFFIGVGAVVASALPWLLTRFGVSNAAAPGHIPQTVHIAFYAGGAVLFGTVLWTVVRSREYPPEELRAFADCTPPWPPSDASGAWTTGLALMALGLPGIVAIYCFGWSAQLYLLAGGLFVFGASFLWLSFTQSRGMMRQVVADLYGMPAPMRRLAWVQFFSWFGLFAMWIYATPAVAAVQFGNADPRSAAYNAGANWVGVLFGAYNGFAMLAAVAIPWMVRAMGLRWSHLVNLALCGLGMASFAFVRDPDWLLLSMLGVGFGWASILSLPYTMLSDSLPAAKMGVYMGIFNFFIVVPQLLASAALGLLLRVLFDNHPANVLVLGGASLVIAGVCTLGVRVGPPAAEPAADSVQPVASSR